MKYKFNIKTKKKLYGAYFYIKLLQKLFFSYQIERKQVMFAK